MHSTNSVWILVTAGLGSKDFEEAADRVARDFRSLNVVTETLILREGNLPNLCPKVYSRYHTILNSSVRGYGYMSWKAEIVRTAFLYGNKKYPQSDIGVIWVDAGCEIFTSTMSKMRLRWMLRQAETNGLIAFSLKTTDGQYTKREVLSFLQVSASDYSSPQKQTTFFILHGNRGAEFAGTWLDLVLEGCWIVDETISTTQLPEFVAHRHDQSVFSVLAKMLKLRFEFSPPPQGFSWGLGGLRAVTWPIWSTRNRTGTSQVPTWLSALCK